MKGQPLKTRSGRFKLTHEIVAAHGGGPVVCLDARAIGQTYKLHASRPQARTDARAYLSSIRGQVVSAGPSVSELGAADETLVSVVEIRGPLEQRAGYHDECGGWSDGHDAVAERLCAAFEEGDVVMVIDSPGGAHAGLQEAVRRVVEAKAQYGRKVYAFADETIGSAAYWWAACVADEIHVPEAGVVGSVGARSAHCSVADALKKDGVKYTYFAWPNEGKVAFAPELPLSNLGRARGERDVALAGEAFAAAVCSARGMSREAIVDLGADALTGQAAVDAGLCDGVSTLEDVINLALASASADTTNAAGAAGTRNQAMPTKTGGIRTAESYERTTKERYESDEEKERDEDKDKDEESPESKSDPDEKDEGAPESKRDEDKDGDDAPDSKRDEDDDPDKKDEDDAPESKRDEGPPSSPMRPKSKASASRPAARSTKTLAGLCGLRDGASEAAIRASVLRKNAVISAVAQLTGARGEDEMVGALRAVADDIGELAIVRADNKKLKATAERRERMDLLRKLSAAKLAGYTRGELFVDEVDGKSKRTVTKPAPVYAEMKLGTLRGLVEKKLASASPSARNTPFEPDQKRAENAREAAQIERVVSTPEIQRLAARSEASPDQLAKTMAALTQSGAFQNGVN